MATGTHCISPREELWLMNTICTTGYLEYSAETGQNVGLFFEYIAGVSFGKAEAGLISKKVAFRVGNSGKLSVV
jgi:hypothetical protein